MTFDDIKRIAREILEDLIGNEYGFHTGGSYGIELDHDQKSKILDEVAHEIAGRITRESM